MNAFKNFLAQLIGPSIIGQFMRGFVKVIAGYFFKMGLEDKVINDFTSALENFLVAVALFLLSQGASAVATKKALETPPGEKPEVPKMLKPKE